MGQLQQFKQLRALQLLNRGIEQARDRRIGKADVAVGVDHQNTFGGILQDGRIERPGRLQFARQPLLHAPVTLLVQLRLHLGLEDLRVERLEQVVHRTTGIALEHSGIGLLVGGKEDDRGQPGTVATTHQPRNLETVHFRHLHVEQHKVDFVLQQGAQGFRP